MKLQESNILLGNINSPETILIEKDGKPKITGFGLLNINCKDQFKILNMSDEEYK